MTNITEENNQAINSDLVEVRVADLNGEALNWAFAIALGYTCKPVAITNTSGVSKCIGLVYVYMYTFKDGNEEMSSGFNAVDRWLERAMVSGNISVECVLANSYDKRWHAYRHTQASCTSEKILSHEAWSDGPEISVARSYILYARGETVKVPMILLS